MNRDSRYHISNESCSSGLWATLRKRIALTVVASALMIGMAGCSLDDVMMPIGGEIPFEKETTAPSEMGVVDNAPTVPRDGAFGNIDDRPL